jgi:hypothetical protein
MRVCVCNLVTFIQKLVTPALHAYSDQHMIESTGTMKIKNGRL